MKSAYQIIRRPVITEKGLGIKETEGTLVFEVAAKARPYEKVAVGKNIEYVIEAIRTEGTSGWRAPAQDEFALVMDGEVEIRLLKLDNPATVPAGTRGSIELPGKAA